MGFWGGGGGGGVQSSRDLGQPLGVVAAYKGKELVDEPSGGLSRPIVVFAAVACPCLLLVWP